MIRRIVTAGLCMGLALLAGCDESTDTSPPADSTAPGTLSANPPFRIASLSAASLQAELGASSAGAQLLTIAGTPACGVDVYYLRFWTKGGANETTESSGALMVPTGAAPTCAGPRPMVLYAHGTNPDKTLNLADVTNPGNSEGVLLAAMFAAQGFIVVAPNYAGYDISTLGYHPFLNAVQQSGEMIDSLSAARTALPQTFAAATSDNGKLFVTGYSEGGHVAMATQRELQTRGTPPTAAAPMSGPYALEAFGDAIFYGNVDLGATVFSPLLGTSYQRAYGNIYSTPSDLYAPMYVNGIETLLPSATPIATIFASGLLPQTAVFNVATPVVAIPGNPALSAELTAALAVPSDPSNPQTPLFALGFGTSYLVNNSYRVNYALDAASNPDGAVPTKVANTPLAATMPTQPLRQAFYKNDLRNGAWTPAEPTLLCGGNADPTVFFSVNTLTMVSSWGAAAAAATVLDVSGTPGGPFAAIQAGFQGSQAQQFAFLQTPSGGGLTPLQAQLQLVQGYHAAVAPFCTLAARAFFSQF